MSSKEDIDADPVRQSYSNQNSQTDQLQALQTLLQSLLHLIGPQAPAVIPGALYTRNQIESNLGIGDKTTTLWIDHGLKPYTPGTRKQLFLGEEVINFVKTHEDLEHPENYRARVEQRKRGRSK